ncbi:MAG: hypothetical protein GY754_07910 [bacterium]|nr:hypothetical protein [bacterium]
MIKKVLSIIGFIWGISALILFLYVVFESRKWKHINSSIQNDYFAAFVSSLFLGPIGLILLLIEKINEFFKNEIK